MMGCVIYQHIYVRQWEIIHEANFIQITIINTHSDLFIFLWNMYYIFHFEESYIKLLLNLLLDL